MYKLFFEKSIGICHYKTLKVKSRVKTPLKKNISKFYIKYFFLNLFCFKILPGVVASVVTLACVVCATVVVVSSLFWTCLINSTALLGLRLKTLA